MKASNLRFLRAKDGSFTFDTGGLKGVLRQKGQSIGLVPVTYTADGTEITGGEGLFNHYRVFTRGKRYGYGARRWPNRTPVLGSSPPTVKKNIIQTTCHSSVTTSRLVRTQVLVRGWSCCPIQRRRRFWKSRTVF